jgi:hypothetical protein
MATVSYPALRCSQLKNGVQLVLFSAPATDIDEWGGVPQKKRTSDDAETTGFQRDENEKRVDELVSFMRDPHNVIQNPLLCATQSDLCGFVRFMPSTSDENQAAVPGFLEIEVPDFSNMSLLTCMKHVKQLLESRVPELRTHAVSIELINQLKQRIEVPPSESEHAADEADDLIEAGDTAESPADRAEEQEVTEVVFSDESHILDFWHELAARIHILEELKDSQDRQELLGFGIDAMIAFLKPIVVMDGQHRLRGALMTAKRVANESTEFQEVIEEALASGDTPAVAQRRAERRACRDLPISLLLSTDPAEHVFQFVVVNQKATPIGKALLGTIVSTTLSNDELNRVSTRLTKAGIQLEQSRAVAYLSRNPDSPFKDQVETGLAGESGDRLAWSVLASLVRIFQHLEGGKLFGQKIDFADKWRRDCLEESKVVSGYESRGYETPFAYWSSPDGPWRQIFIEFYKNIRAEFGKEDPESFAYWGLPKSSNLFNKISLWILGADFFQFLVDRKYSIDSPNEVRNFMTEWLDGVSRDYFNRDWKMAKTKKDTPAIREQWSKLWTDYRKDPQRMPKSTEYRKNI